MKPDEVIRIGRRAYKAMTKMNFARRVAYARETLEDVLKIQAKYQQNADL